jgi:hypothetical protein
MTSDLEGLYDSLGERVGENGEKLHGSCGKTKHEEDN